MEPTAGQRRAAITKSHEKVRRSWEANLAHFAQRHPDFALFQGTFEKAHIRLSKEGALLFDPAYVLELLSQLEKLEERLKVLEKKAKE